MGCFLTHKHPSANPHGTAVARPALLSWTVAGASDLLGASSPFLTQDPFLVLPVGGSSPSPQADPQSCEQTLVPAPARAPSAPSLSRLQPGRHTRGPRRHSPDYMLCPWNAPLSSFGVRFRTPSPTQLGALDPAPEGRALSLCCPRSSSPFHPLGCHPCGRQAGPRWPGLPSDPGTEQGTARVGVCTGGGGRWARGARPRSVLGPTLAVGRLASPRPTGLCPPHGRVGRLVALFLQQVLSEPSQGWCALWGVDAFPCRASLLVRWRNGALSVCEQMACLPAGHSGLSLPAGRRPFSLSVSHVPPASPRPEASSLPPTPTDQPSKIHKHASVHPERSKPSHRTSEDARCHPGRGWAKVP